MQLFVGKFHYPAGWIISGLDRLTTPGLRMVAHVTVPTSGQRIVIYLAAARNLPVRGLSSTLVETFIFRPEDPILPGWEKFSTSCWRIRFFLGKFQLSGRKIEIDNVEHESYLLEKLSSKLVESNIIRPENPIPAVCAKFSTSGRRMQFLMWKFQLFTRRIKIYLAESGSFLLQTLSSILVETKNSRPED